MADKEQRIRIDSVTNSTFVAGDVHGNIHNTVSGQSSGSVDYAVLIEELAKLREAMLQEARTTEQVIAVGKVAEAEKAALDRNGAGVLDALKSAGKWAVDVATKIGVSVVADILKQALGIP